MPHWSTHDHVGVQWAGFFGLVVRLQLEAKLEVLAFCYPSNYFEVLVYVVCVPFLYGVVVQLVCLQLS